MGRVYYKESVQLSARKFWRFIPVFMGLMILSEMIMNDNVHLNLTSIVSVVALITATGVLSYLINSLQLKVKITSKGIQYKMMPFFKKKRIILWDEIASCSIVESPRVSSADRRILVNFMERKITLTGNNGLSILTYSGERYLIGSKQPRKINRALKKVMRKINK